MTSQFWKLEMQRPFAYECKSIQNLSKLEGLANLHPHKYKCFDLLKCTFTLVQQLGLQLGLWSDTFFPRPKQGNKTKLKNLFESGTRQFLTITIKLYMFTKCDRSNDKTTLHLHSSDKVTDTKGSPRTFMT